MLCEDAVLAGNVARVSHPEHVVVLRSQVGAGVEVALQAVVEVPAERDGLACRRVGAEPLTRCETGHIYRPERRWRHLRDCGGCCKEQYAKPEPWRHGSGVTVDRSPLVASGLREPRVCQSTARGLLGERPEPWQRQLAVASVCTVQLIMTAPRGAVLKSATRAAVDSPSKSCEWGLLLRRETGRSTSIKVGLCEGGWVTSALPTSL